MFNMFQNKYKINKEYSIYIFGNYVKCIRIFKELYYVVGVVVVRVVFRLVEEFRGILVKFIDNKLEKKVVILFEKFSIVSYQKNKVLKNSYFIVVNQYNRKNQVFFNY